jgi:hypothetical protein
MCTNQEIRSMQSPQPISTIIENDGKNGLRTTSSGQMERMRISPHAKCFLPDALNQ